MEQSFTKTEYLKLTRFCGEELYPIKTADWYFYKNEDTNANELWLEISTNEGHQLSEDTQYLNGRPHWELTFQLDDLNINDLTSGLKLEIIESYNETLEDNVTNFYYCEHEATDNNHFEIIDKKDNRLLIRLTGEVTDINYYDGSKPKNKIFVETWFEKK